MSFIDDVNNTMNPMVGGSGDYPQRMLNESFVQQNPLAFSQASGPAPKNVAGPSPLDEVKEEQENLSDRLDKLEADTTKKPKSAKEFWKKHSKKIKTGVLVGIALYAGYRLFLKGKLNFGRGGSTEPMPQAAPAPAADPAGEINSADI